MDQIYGLLMGVELYLFIYLFLSWSENKDTFTMCLFGWILGKKKGRKRKFWVFDWMYQWVKN